MRFFHSIRWRMQLWHGLLLALVLAGFGFTAWRLQWADQIRRTDQELQQRVSVIVSIRRAKPPVENSPPPTARPAPPPFPPLSAHDAGLFEKQLGKAFYFVVWSPDGLEVARSPSAPVDVPRPGPVPDPIGTHFRGGLRECFHFTPPGECFLVGLDIHDKLAGLRRFAWLLAGIGGLVWVSGLAVGWWISSRVIRPIADMSRAAEGISAGDLSQRICAADADSELGQLAGVLNSTFARLEAAFARQARFTADAAHELRTPLTVMLTHMQNGLTGECANEEHREAFEAGQRAAQRMRRLVESLLDLARLEDGREAMRREPVDLADVVRDGVHLLQPLAVQGGIRLVTELSAAPCAGDAERLGQVVANLVSNAIQFTPSGGDVRVKTRGDNGGVEVVVSDNGPGIAEADLPHIFERFYRAETSRSAGRAGLGLPIARAIVEAHGGTIEVDSRRPGQGATFRVRLPVSVVGG